MKASEGSSSMNPAPFLEEEFIYLRALTETDCTGPYASWLNDAEVCRYNGHHQFPYRLEEALAYVRKVEPSPTDLVLAIVQNLDERHIGNVSLQNIDPVNRNAEFAILIGEKDCWGKGYSKAAGRLLLDHGFRSLNLHRIYCGTAEDNLPMRKLAAYLGMRQEGQRRQALYKENCYLNVIEYGLLRKEFLERFHPESVHTQPKRSTDAEPSP